MPTSSSKDSAAQSGSHGYAYHLSGDHILGYRLDEDDRLTEIRIQERAIVADGDWGEKEVCRVRVFKREGEHVTWSLYDEDGTALVVDQAFALKEIPVVPVHSSAVVASGELFAHPPLKDLAFMNIRHYQESSDQSNILRIARVPVLFASGVAEEASIAIGSEYAIKGESGAGLKCVEHSGAAIGAERDSLKDLEAKMQSYGSDNVGEQRRRRDGYWPGAASWRDQQPCRHDRFELGVGIGEGSGLDRVL